MKKSLIALALFTALAASATEIGVTTGRNLNSRDAETVGVTLGQKFDTVGVQGSFDRAYNKTNDVNRFKVTASYDLLSAGPVTGYVFGGGAYMRSQSQGSGYAAVAGVGASYALTKTVSVNAELANQRGQSRVAGLNGNAVSVGLKYSF